MGRDAGGTWDGAGGAHCDCCGCCGCCVGGGKGVPGAGGAGVCKAGGAGAWGIAGGTGATSVARLEASSGTSAALVHAGIPAHHTSEWGIKPLLMSCSTVKGPNFSVPFAK